jgi:hypothetical protein
MEGRHGSLEAAKSGEVISGSHANDIRHDQRLFGIEIESYYVGEFAKTDQQWNSLIELSAWLAFWENFDPGQMKDHKQVIEADCLGLVVDHLADQERHAAVGGGNSARWLTVGSRG